MATPDSFDLQRERTKRLQATGEVPMPTAGAPTTPAAQPRRQFSSSIGGKIGQAIYNTPGEVRSALRDLGRDPIGTIETATAPLVGAGSGIRALGAGTNALRGARGLPGAMGAAPAIRASLPSASQAVLGSGALAFGGTTLASVDQEQSRGQAAQTAGVQTLPAVEAKIPEVERQRAFDGRAKELLLNPPRDQVSAGGAPESMSLRSRTQGAVIENPHAMSDIDKLHSAMQQFKGSPSMREAAAKMIMGERAAKDTHRQAELDANMGADAAMAEGNARMREAFAERRLKAQITNAELTEDARQADQREKTIRGGQMLVAGAAARRGVGRSGDGSIADQVFQSMLKDDPLGAAKMAQLFGNASGQPGENDYDRIYDTLRTQQLAEGVGAASDRWISGNPKDFDPATARQVDPTLKERLFHITDPAGVKRFWDPGDVRFQDSEGRRAWGDASSLPQGETQNMRDLYKRQRDARIARGAAAGRE